MLLNSNPKEFLRQFKIAASVTSKSFPDVLVKVSEDTKHVTLTAHDGEETGISIAVDVNVISAGDRYVNAKELTETLKEAKDKKNVTINETSTSIGRFINQHITSVHQHIDTTQLNCIAIDATQILTAIDRTIFAVKVNSKYEVSNRFQGILFEWDLDGKLDVIATNGRQIACQRIPCGVYHQHKEEEQVLVPLSALKLLKKVLKKTDTVKMSVKTLKSGERIALFDIGGRLTIYSVLMKCRFPSQWRDILNIEPKINISSLEIMFLKEAMEHLSTTPISQVDFIFADNEFSLNGRCTENKQESIPHAIVENIDFAGNATCTYDPKYISDMLKPFHKGKATITIGEDDEAKFVTDDGYTYLLAPISR